MKTLAILAALVVTALALYAADGQPPLPQGGQIGRFQLCQGSKVAANQSQTVPALFRIDTVTGQTWELASNALVAADGTTAVFNVWQGVEEPGGQLHQAAMANLQARLSAGK